MLVINPDVAGIKSCKEEFETIIDRHFPLSLYSPHTEKPIPIQFLYINLRQCKLSEDSQDTIEGDLHDMVK